MSITLDSLIWLLPAAFMFHDFEEIILGEAWLKKNGAEVQSRLGKIFPPAVMKQVEAVFHKSTPELSVAVSLIFALTVLASFLAAVYGIYGPFLAASGMFFLHGWMHVGQSLALRCYVPAVATSLLVVIPYGLVLFGRLFAEKIVTLPALALYSLVGIVLMVPFILVMHQAGERVYRSVLRQVERG